MIEHPATLMFAGAAIGATVTCLFFIPRFRSLTAKFHELTGRASATGVRVTEQALEIERLNESAKGRFVFFQKMELATETLHAAAAQNTIAGARKVIAEGLERVRCIGGHDQPEQPEGKE